MLQRAPFLAPLNGPADNESGPKPAGRRPEAERLWRLSGVVLTILAIAGIGFSFWYARDQYRVLITWPAVEAEVEGSRVVAGQDAAGSRMYRAQGDFRYRVEGAPRFATARSRAQWRDPSQAQRIVDVISPGSVRPVRYNPANPSEIVFDADFSMEYLGAAFALLFAGTTLIVPGLMALYLGFRPPERRCPVCSHALSRTNRFCPVCETAVIN
jgi:Protein of unknown function (DUF3592)